MTHKNFEFLLVTDNLYTTFAHMEGTNIFKLLAAPRYCDVTHEGMWEGWFVMHNNMYIKFEDDAKLYALNSGYKSLQDAMDDDYILWNDWNDEPEEHWDEMPLTLPLRHLMAEMQGLVDTIRTTKYMTEVSAPYQAILDDYREYLNNTTIDE